MMSKNLKAINMSAASCRSVRHINPDVSSNTENPDLSPLRITIRWGMERLAHEVQTNHPEADMLAVKLLVVEEMNRQGWGQ